MLTEKELSVINLSPTKKDFYQIWTELIETARKLSERWDPTSTNESDPGIVLLKVLTGIADKLNYNIDKNILEAFMPSAAQIESVRKLCDILGYHMGYYKSATTEVTIAYTGDPYKDLELVNNGAGLPIPMFTTITNIDKDISYVTTNQHTIYLTKEVPVRRIPCIEGQIVQCESDNNNVITGKQIDDKFRYYLPETQIAENGIFIYNQSAGNLVSSWKHINNLNTQTNNSRVFTFGFDSSMTRPYIQFPQDVEQLIEDGLAIFYTRTKGIAGNISVKTLTTLEPPALEVWENFENADKVAAYNTAVATNGRNIESISEAYTNFKRTIGTFDTLVTCRDYINKIYTMVDEADRNLVSNVVVSDIRDDINNAITLCSVNEQGIVYNEMPLVDEDTKKEKINNFDLILYPFNVYRNNNTKEDYVGSFKYTSKNLLEITNGLKENKTISHTFKSPTEEELVCIKNYWKLNARITTTVKVNPVEEISIISNIKHAIYNEFNLRVLDFGEPLPFDMILECIEGADPRIKNVALDEPILYTKFMTANGREYDLASALEKPEKGINKGRQLYNKLILRNILAGRVALFNYESTFKSSYAERKYSGQYYPKGPDGETLPAEDYAQVYPESKNKEIISSIEANCEFKALKDSNVIEPDTTLSANEVIKFRAPNVRTILTYSAYTFYYFRANPSAITQAQAAVATPTNEFLAKLPKEKQKAFWEGLINRNEHGTGICQIDKQSIKQLVKNDQYDEVKNKYGALFTVDSKGLYTLDESTGERKGTYYYIEMTHTNYGMWTDNIKKYSPTKTGFYKDAYMTRPKSNIQPGYLVTLAKNEYIESIQKPQMASDELLSKLFVMENLGTDAAAKEIPINSDYELDDGEFLLFHYTPSATTDEGASPEPQNVYYGPGTIIHCNGFSLKDSNVMHDSLGKSFVKTSGFDFSETPAGSEKINGLYSLAQDESLEIKKPIQVTLDDQTMYLYWNFKNSISDNQTYTLKDGEYLFYTNRSKTDLAYVGKGTEIYVKGTRLPGNTSEEVSIETILVGGIDVVPWVSYNFKKSESEEYRSYIELTEYQYITLTSGDTLHNLELISGKEEQKGGITSKWKDCYNLPDNRVTYTMNGVEGQLPLIKIKKHTGDTKTALNWQVRSFLDFNLGPDNPQTLDKRDKVTLSFFALDDDGNPIIVDKPKQIILQSDPETAKPLTLKANVDIVTSSERIETMIKTEKADGTTDYDAPLKIKLFEEKPVYIYRPNKDGEYTQPELVNTELKTSVKDRWLNISLQGDNATEEHPTYIDLNVNIPDPVNNYGLVLVYYEQLNTVGEGDQRSYAAFTDTSFEDPQHINKDLTIFNYYIDQKESWWAELPTSNKKFTLRTGVNIIKIKESGTLRLAGIGKDNGSLKIGALDIIKVQDKDQGVNLDLLEYHIEKRPQSDVADPAVWDSRELRAKDLLDKINKIDIDHVFYYNTPLDNSTAIELNSGLDSQATRTKMSSPYLWYDYNNINNKFVISEIDADYLDEGIQIARSSKLAY